MALDIKGAFDNISQEAILTGLDNLNCGMKIQSYVKAFWSNRTATIGLGELRSEKFNTPKKGTPQGSVISPILFNVAMIGLAQQLDQIDGVRHAIVFLTILGAIVVMGTTADLYLARKARRNDKIGILTTYLIAFSAAANTGFITRTTKTNSDVYGLRFLHGMRLLSLVWIMLGHSYGTISDTLSGMANNIGYFERWENMIVTGGYLSVDTFFFLSGFLMCYTIAKQRASGWIIFLLATIRRFIRSTTPVFFMIMCMYLLPAITSGPDAKSFFDKFYYEVNNHWWDLLLQIRNFRGEITFSVLPHIWYLSADYQLFLVSLVIVLLLKNRHRCAIGAFVLLSLLSCSLATWQVAGTHMNPFMVAMTETVPMLMDTMNNYYVLPFYHAVAYFSGCITYFLMNEYKERPLSKYEELP
ncbi:nose resistant to fluoxetine protein 6-like [Dermacentor andersoni]|uniref:nose resistant to fluoxetine protein 6-like n=1 Tax=Dermacentor andersoni TaxID=34620 RepID=UPI003B3A92A5